jgi:hypothetical protein
LADLTAVYADGRVLSLQSSEEPATIVRQLQPGLRISGLLEGRWTLVDGVLACHLENLALAPHLRRHTFELHARLKSTTRGRMYVLRSTAAQSSEINPSGTS